MPAGYVRLRCSSYTFGNCTRGVCQLASWIPDGLGNATDWVAHARAFGLRITNIPVVGSIVVYAGGSGYSAYGHVAVVTQIMSGDRFLVREMNYVRFNGYDDRASTMYDVEGFILPPGVPTPQQAAAAILATPGTPADLGLAWARVQDTWNVVLDAEVNQLAGIAGALRALTAS